MKRGNEAFAVGTSLPPMSPLGEALFAEGVRRMFEPIPAKRLRAIEASLDAQDLNLSRGVVLPAYPVKP